VIIYGVGLLFRMGHRLSLATGITLAQIGEFSFVLAAVARSGGLISADVFALILSVTILSMFLGPYMVVYAESLAALAIARLPRSLKQPPQGGDRTAGECSRRIVIIGFGPAGQQVAAALQGEGLTPEVVELNPKSAAKARENKLVVHIGDAIAGDVLAHAGVPDAGLVVVTVPDPRTAAHIIASTRQLAPLAIIIARSRYHIAGKELRHAGADVTVDEEHTVGINLAREVLGVLHQSNRDALACALTGERPSPDRMADGHAPAGIESADRKERRP
jgi:CPA2 family monovalent cation:H+ antiporter-2